MLIDPSTFVFESPKGFVVLEGLNGAGKTSLQSRISAEIERTGRKAIATREPGATALGKTLRSLVLEQRDEQIAPSAEMFLFAADRAQHVEKLIRPSLAAGHCVVSDRYYYSSIAFQGWGRGLDSAMIEQINLVAVADMHPDLVILLDIDPALGLSRSLARESGGQNKSGPDAFEQEKLDFHERIRAGFLALSRSSSAPFMVVDASKSADEVFSFVRPVIQKWLGSLCKKS